MKAGTITCLAGLRTAQTPRGRGRPVGRALTCTDDFTNKKTLSAEHRQLVLFLVVVLTRDDGCLTRMYERMITRHAHQPGHWLHGKTVEQMQSSCSKYLGKSAMYHLRWYMITDALRVQVPPEQLPTILAYAAGLYCRAAGVEHPGGEYQGEITEPAWTTDTVVTIDMIQHLLTGLPTSDAPETGTAEEVSGGIEGQLDPMLLDLLEEIAQLRAQRDDTQAELDNTRALLKATQTQLDEVTKDRDAYRQMQTILNRGTLALHRQVDQLQEELTVRRRDLILSDIITENDQLRDRSIDLAKQLAHLKSQYATLLQSKLLPDISRDTLLSVAHDQAEAGLTRRHGLNNLEVLPTVAGGYGDMRIPGYAPYGERAPGPRSLKPHPPRAPRPPHPRSPQPQPPGPA
ncbi:hypothetical protein [Amycolatopsis sp. cg9]|uniref:hypothetical protein n=1 Tax=Amycolatopsis sp. cg9 TaxID=3238801 RepID=UPI0035268E56